MRRHFMRRPGMCGRQPTEASFHLMRAIAKHYRATSTPITVSELAEHLGISPSAASQSISALEKFGVIRRKTSATDSRVTHILLTRKGKFFSAKFNHRSHHQQILVDLIDHLGPDDAQELIRLLGRIDDFFATRDPKLHV
jgi:DNA-binding MarR family transcriptional regulator